MTDQGAAPDSQPDPQPGAPGSAEDEATCSWCAAPAAHDAIRCSACGAALAQHESLGGVRIPGLTSVDPALEDFDKRPLHIRGPSPTQGLAPAFIIGALAGGPAGLVAMGGVAALAGMEFAASQHDGTDALELADVGRPSGVAVQALQQLEEAKEAPSGGVPGSGQPAAGTNATGEATTDNPEDAAAADGGMSIWRDLPGS